MLSKINMLLLSAMLAVSVTSQASAQEASEKGANLSANFDLWVGNDYITTHGVVITSEGTTIQTNSAATLSLPSGVSLTAGVWNDINPGYDKSWITTTANETDLYFAINVPANDRLSLGVKYVAFITDNLPQTAHNIELMASYSDGGPDSSFAINPYAILFYEIDGSSVTGVGKAGNTGDLRLGVTPTLKLKDFTISAPSWITIGPKSFFGPIDDGNIGLITSGLKFSKSFSVSPEGGSLSISANVQWYHLANDNLRLIKSIINNGDSGRNHFQFGIGISVGL